MAGAIGSFSGRRGDLFGAICRATSRRRYQRPVYNIGSDIRRGDHRGDQRSPNIDRPVGSKTHLLFPAEGCFGCGIGVFYPAYTLDGGN